MKFCNFLNEISLHFLQIKYLEPIIESKSVGVIFQKKGKKKRIKNVKKLGTHFEKGQVITCNYGMQQTAKIDPGSILFQNK